jgi:hypothetical protein
MQVLHLHDSVIKIYDKHLESSGWPDQDAAALQELLLVEKPARCHLYTKSVCILQDVLSARVQVTAMGKKCRLDPEEDNNNILSLVASFDVLVSSTQ